MNMPTEDHPDMDGTSAIVLYSHSNPFVDTLKLEERNLCFFGKALKIKQAWSADGRGGTDIGFGASVYNCSLVLSLYLEKNSTQVFNKIVVELGCGPGLTSIVASCAGAKTVFMTDGDQLSVNLGNDNCQCNLAGSKIYGKKLLWGDYGDIDALKSQMHEMCGCNQADVILASDVAALPYCGAYTQLVDTMFALCRPGGTVLLAYQRRHSTEDDFFDALNDKFDVMRLPAHDVHTDFNGLPISIFRATPKFLPPTSASELELVLNCSFVKNRPPLTLQPAFFFSAKCFKFLPPVRRSVTADGCSSETHVPTGDRATLKENLLAIGLNRVAKGKADTDCASQLLEPCCYAIAEPLSGLPLLLTSRLVLREIRADDAADFLHLRRSLEAVPGCLDVWGSDVLPGGGVSAAQSGEACAPTAGEDSQADAPVMSGGGGGGDDGDAPAKPVAAAYGASINITEAMNSAGVSGPSAGSRERLFKGGLQAAADKIADMISGRKSLRSITWGISLRNDHNSASSGLGTMKQVAGKVSCHDAAIAEALLDGDRSALLELTSSRLIGTIGFWRMDKSQYSAEVGYSLHPEHWGGGLTSEALRAVTAFGFTCMRLHSIEANADPRNGRQVTLIIATFDSMSSFFCLARELALDCIERSLGVLRRIGFEKEAHFKEHYYHENIFKDSVISRLVERKWKTEQAELEQILSEM